MNSAPLVGVSTGHIKWRFEQQHVLEHGEREPEQEDELESVVEGEPVDNAHKALHNAARRVRWGRWRFGGRATNVRKEKTTQY